jgi:Na+/H+ antiporter NhaA
MRKPLDLYWSVVLLILHSQILFFGNAIPRNLHIKLAGQSIEQINDGLMTIFFLLIGLELEREIYPGS